LLRCPRIQIQPTGRKGGEEKQRTLKILNLNSLEFAGTGVIEPNTYKQAMKSPEAGGEKKKRKDRRQIGQYMGF